MAQIGKSTELHIALIADLVGSRELPDRASIQEGLLAELAAQNEAHAPALASDLELTGGDEFEGLFHRPEPVFEVVRALSDHLRPLRLTFGLGLGELSTPLPRARAQRRVGALDGPAFHHARAALGEARERDAWIAVRGFGVGADAALSSLGELLGSLRDDWTDKQARYVREARREQQKTVARHFDVSPSVVSESLKAARFELCVRAEEAFAIALREFGESTSSRASSAR